jgi:hypothetical protein
MNLKKFFLALSTLTLISACGDDKAHNEAPEIIGWSMFTSINSAEQYHELTTRAVDPDGDKLTYEWRLLTETDQVTLADNTSLSTLMFVYAVSVSEEVNNLVFEVTVTDESGASTSGTYEQDFNDYVFISLPTEMTVQVGQEVTVSPTLFGRPSYISNYQWHVTSDHDITLIGSDTKQVSFVAPDSQTPISLSLTTTLIDGRDEERMMDITITQ